MANPSQSTSSASDPPAGRTKDLTILPLFAQALVACRLARRAALAMLFGDVQKSALAACDEIDGIIRRGSGWYDKHPGIAATAKAKRTRETQAALEAVRWANDSAGAAQGANDFPVDAVVTASTQRCIEAVCRDRRVSPVQVGIILASDVDSLDFACKEAHVHTYDPVKQSVFARLAPCHPLTLADPRASAQEEAR